MIDLSQLDPQPAGFGNCPRCAYVMNDSPAVCYACARLDMENLAPADARCLICDQPIRAGADGCGNRLCRLPESERYFGWNYAITMRTGTIKNAITRFKYRDGKGWAFVFGRILVGFLESNDLFDEFDALIPSPTFVSPSGPRTWDHTRAVIESAAQLNTTLPFYLDDPPMIRKTRQTMTMVEAGGHWERLKVAEGELRDSLFVPSPHVTTGRNVLVYDDVFTDGLTLREVARALIVQGRASRVCGVTLTRQPWSDS